MDIKYIGCDDAGMNLFESQYVTPEGMCYNSYLIMDEKVAVMDSVDPRKTDEWMQNLSAALNGRTPDYLIVQHMEPDHSGSLKAFRKAYPAATIVASEKALTFMAQFNEGVDFSPTMAVKEGDVLNLGSRSLKFIGAAMIHWPEVIVTYCPEEKTLFSADGFGKFGVIDADADDWACEARRYYFNICGKYGAPVTTLLKKASALDIQTICPLHGPILEGEKLSEALRLYSIWSSYGVETEGVLVAHASIHGNTKKAAEKLADILKEKGAAKVVVADLCRDDMAEVIEDAFRMNRLVVCASSYDGDVFPPMHMFLWKLKMKAYQNRTVGILENGTWAPSAGKAMRALLEQMKNVNIVEPAVTIRSSMKQTDIPALEALADAVLG
ncbi:MAG: MBL fold metallo-hydrolase [Bacteroidaceae bacterium]|jgi:flavorubredoxin|nr:MBL fold metallo-hydrolase [Bacteroidaceae bacterium]